MHAIHASTCTDGRVAANREFAAAQSGLGRFPRNFAALDNGEHGWVNEFVHEVLPRVRADQHKIAHFADLRANFQPRTQLGTNLERAVRGAAIHGSRRVDGRSHECFVQRHAHHHSGLRAASEGRLRAARLRLTKFMTKGIDMQCAFGLKSLPSATGTSARQTHTRAGKAT